MTTDFLLAVHIIFTFIYFYLAIYCSSFFKKRKRDKKIEYKSEAGKTRERKGELVRVHVCDHCGKTMYTVGGGVSAAHFIDEISCYWSSCNAQQRTKQINNNSIWI